MAGLLGEINVDLKVICQVKRPLKICVVVCHVIHDWFSMREQIVLGMYLLMVLVLCVNILNLLMTYYSNALY